MINMAKTAMAVDECSALRTFVVFALRARGLIMLIARDGKAALEKPARASVMLIITDLKRPTRDGFGLPRVIRDDHEHGDLPIPLFSGARRRCGKASAPAPFAPSSNPSTRNVSGTKSQHTSSEVPYEIPRRG